MKKTVDRRSKKTYLECIDRRSFEVSFLLLDHVFRRRTVRAEQFQTHVTITTSIVHIARVNSQLVRDHYETRKHIRSFSRCLLNSLHGRNEPRLESCTCRVRFVRPSPLCFESQSLHEKWNTRPLVGISMVTLSRNQLSAAVSPSCSISTISRSPISGSCKEKVSTRPGSKRFRCINFKGTIAVCRPLWPINRM